jgi:lysophospholipase L1-like esterase
MPSKQIASAILAAVLLLTPAVAVGEPHAAPGVVYSLNPIISPQKRPAPGRFAQRVAAYLQADKASPPPACGIVFVGSASIVGWKTLKADMAPATVLARGLGDSTIEDQIFFFDQLVAPYRPRAIFLYAGENDIVNGLEPKDVLEDLKTFMAVKRKALGSTPVYYIAAKASPARLQFAQKQQMANELAERLARKEPDLHYVDVAHAMWEGGHVLGTLKPIYVRDGIHMTPEGYAAWTRIIKPYVEKEAVRPCAAPA